MPPRTDSLGRPLPDAFWRWFGKSKVVDKKGRPLVVYHGTQAEQDFDVFEYGSAYNEETDTYREWSGDPSAALGPHFADDVNVAGMVAGLTPAPGVYWLRDRARRKHGRILPVYLRVEKPKTYNDESTLLDVLFKGYSYELEAWVEGLGLKGGNLNRIIFEDMLQADDPSAAMSAADDLASDLKHKLIEKGYDGIRYKNAVEGGRGYSWIVFNPTQIKSAIGNTGAFDITSPSIINPPRRTW